MGLEVEGPELIDADDDLGVSGSGRGDPVGDAYSSSTRFFLASKSGSVEDFQVFARWKADALLV